MSPPRPLRVETFPLLGSQLIEASAGTGKTWTIAMLYLRLVLGPHHDGLEAIARPLHPRDILVVTFTEAATQELKDRIRQRLAEAAAVFREPSRAEADWPAALRPIAALRALYPEGQWPTLAQRLQTAADAMDEAAIFTLHGWSHRVLREQAFASGTPFTLSLLPDLGDAIDEAVADLWRLQYRTLPVALAKPVATAWNDPEALGDALRPLLPHADHWAQQDAALADTPVEELLSRAQDERRAALARLKQPLPMQVDEAKAALQSHGLLGAMGTARHVDRWFSDLATWAMSDDDTPPRLNTGWDRLTLAHLKAQVGDALPAEVATLPLWQTLGTLRTDLQALPSPLGRLLRHAAVWVGRRVGQRLAERDQIGFDGLLARLAQALDSGDDSPLAARLRERFPVALVDEFQDTDPVQLRILDRIYPLAQPAPGTALILIGDPKQAIYAFRQADIHSYLQARRACEGRLWRLDTNHRSSEAMVAAVNHLFGQAEHRRPEGAFRFGQGADTPVPFTAVQARGRAERWGAGPDTPPEPALVVAHLPRPDGGPWNQERLREAVAGACADTVARWLQDAADGRAGFWTPASGDTPARWSPLQPEDIAILVNDRFEAAALQTALFERGVASVYLSERESVYASPEAEDLERWLQACAHPRDGTALRAALATASLGLSPATLDAWTRDDGAWEQMLERFAHYQSVWQRHGVLPAVRTLLHDFRVPERLLGDDASRHRGERALTNLLHLAELLQQTTDGGAGHRDPVAVLRHLRRSRQRAERGAPPDGGDSATPQLRLDSERDRVQIITVHKSKGLEYPLVCYPFAGQARPMGDRLARQTQGVRTLTWHDDQGWLQVTLSDEGERWQQALARAEEERWAEDVRRLYVALTRARHATWIGVAATDVLPQSALGHLLGIDSTAGDLDAAIESALHRLTADNAVIALERRLRDTPPQRLRAEPAAGHVARAARIAPATRRQRWWIASYTALLAESTGAPGPDEDAPAAWPDAPDSARDAQFAEDFGTAAPTALGDGAAGPLESVVDTPPEPWHRLPRGALTGTALHAVLEACARSGFAWAAADPGWVLAQAKTALAGQAWPTDRLDRDASDLAAWTRTILATPLSLPGGGPAALRDVARTQAEMEFWLGTAPLSSATLDAWVCHAIEPGATRPALRPATLNGMLKGFIDLVFEHQGRYYVLDHKSNALGADDAAYDPAALQQAVLMNRYELQGVLYLVALHRLLRQRLPDYRPADHLGGMLCVFWRGVHGPTHGVYARPAPIPLIERLDAALAGRGVLPPWETAA